MKRYTDYDTFAWLYNLEWSGIAANIFPGLKLIAGDKIPEGAKILDLCCGTGQLAKVLTEKGYKVTGLDGSSGMLHWAKENAPSAEFILGDARSFNLPPEYDVVFSTFDALNHIMKLEELGQAFKNVFNCLVKGGIFIFDMTLQKNFERAKGHVHFVEKPGYLFMQHPEVDLEKKLLQAKITVFQPEGKLWKRSDINLTQTWYPMKDIKAALANAGFKSIRTHSFNERYETEAPTEDSYRVFFYAEKP
jgi:SAM-dependent methyltransferase